MRIPSRFDFHQACDSTGASLGYSMFTAVVSIVAGARSEYLGGGVVWEVFIVG
jgi:hypothetical protein